jgi:hypothetical protein
LVDTGQTVQLHGLEIRWVVTYIGKLVLVTDISHKSWEGIQLTSCDEAAAEVTIPKIGDG